MADQAEPMQQKGESSSSSATATNAGVDRAGEYGAVLRAEVPREPDTLKTKLDKLSDMMAGFASTLGRVRGYNDDAAFTGGNVTTRDARMRAEERAFSSSLTRAARDNLRISTAAAGLETR